MKKVKVKVFTHVWLLVTPWTVAHQPRGFQGKNTGVGCHFLLQGIFPTQGSNMGLPHCTQTLCHLRNQGIPIQIKPIIYLDISQPLYVFITFETTHNETLSNTAQTKIKLKFSNISQILMTTGSIPELGRSPEEGNSLDCKEIPPVHSEGDQGFLWKEWY